MYAPQGERTAGRSQGSSVSIALMLRRPAIYGGRVQNTQDTDCDACETGAQVDANARLIASAPDLYAALNEGQLLADEVANTWESGDLAGAVRELVAWAMQARSALARARGEVAS